VIVECPHYETNMSRLSVSNIQEVLWIYRLRMIELKRDPQFVHASVFKNKGVLAGASLQHSHSQLIATPVVPVSIWEEITGAMQFYQGQGRSLFSDMIANELQAGVRVVLDTASFLVICPFASRFAFEMLILPKQQSSHFENITERASEELASVLKIVLLKLELALDDPPYNYVIHTAPFNQPELPYYLWHIEIFPRLTRVAGFEWGSGCYINEVLPEMAATILRNTKSE
jgi:UDPglucose--hexose-1-phosphate uridylyltransferase